MNLDMMKVMVRARVESDGARSVFDGLARLHAALAMAESAGVPTVDGRCRRRATLRDALSGMDRVWECWKCNRPHRYESSVPLATG